MYTYIYIPGICMRLFPRLTSSFHFRSALIPLNCVFVVVTWYFVFFSSFLYFFCFVFWYFFHLVHFFHHFICLFYRFVCFSMFLDPLNFCVIQQHARVTALVEASDWPKLWEADELMRELRAGHLLTGFQVGDFWDSDRVAFGLGYVGWDGMGWDGEVCVLSCNGVAWRGVASRGERSVRF